MSKKTLPIYKTNIAQKKFIEIVKWSAKKWGKPAAVNYLNNLDKTISLVASGLLPCQKNIEFSQRFSYCHIESHYIFFEFQDDKVIVATILHTAMNIKERIHQEGLSISHEIANINLKLD